MSRKYSCDPPYNPPHVNRKKGGNAEKQSDEPKKQVNVSSVNKSEVAMVRREGLFLRLTCPLCQSLFDDATTITECMHTFCRKCITEKLQEEENCPVCDLHLGATPTEKIRPDHSIQSLREKLFPPKSTESDRGDKSESVPHAEPAVETGRAESLSSAEVNDSPQKPAQSRRQRKKGSKKKGSAHHGPGPVINEPVVEKVGQVKEEIEQIISKIVESSHNVIIPAPLEAESSRQSLEEREISDKSELVKPLNSLALEHETGTDRDAKGKGVEMPPPDSKGKGKRKGKKERNGAGSSGTTGTAAGQPERKFTNVWFSLVAFHDSNRALILPQISPNIIRIKDGNMTVSSVQKYLTQKLGLSNESEVEVMCQNLPVSPAISMYSLMDLWLQTRPKQKIRATVGQSGEKFVMVLQYRRAKNN